MNDVLDGTSNTLFVAEVGPPVPWTKPADVAYDPRRPFPAVSWPFANLTHVGPGDGAVLALAPNLPASKLRELVAVADGGPRQPWVEGLRVTFPADSADDRAAVKRVTADTVAALDELRRLAEGQADPERAAELNRAVRRLVRILNDDPAIKK